MDNNFVVNILMNVNLNIESSYLYKKIEMTSTAIRKKVHEYIDEADVSIVEVIYKLLEVYRKANNSLMTDEQQDEIIKRSIQFKNGEVKGHTLAEVQNRLKRKYNS